MADDIPEDDDAKEAYAKRCLEKLEHAGESLPSVHDKNA